MQDKTSKNNRQLVFGGITLSVIVVALGWYIFRKETLLDMIPTNSLEKHSTTTVNVGGMEVEVPAGGGVTVEQVPIDNKKDFGPAPDINRAVNFPSSFSEEARTLFMNKLAITKSSIAKDPYSYNSWLQFGQLWEMVEDYEGARQTWEYAAKILPSMSTAFGNLGFLYGYHLHDNVKAEQNFKTALKNDPQAVYLYQQFFEFYRDVLKDTAKARALAEEGKRVTGDIVYFDNLLNNLK